MSFTLIDNSLFEDKRLTVQAQSLLFTLIRYYNKEKGYAFPSIDDIRKASKIKDWRTLNRATESLIEKGYLTKETNYGNGCRYYLNFLAEKDSVDLHNVENSTKCIISPLPSVDLHNDLVDNNTTTNTNINTNTKTNIYADIFKHWNSKNIKTHKELTPDIKKAIDNALKIKMDGKLITDSNIKKAIDNYKEVLESSYYFAHKWTLAEFLTRRQRDTSINQLVLFMDNGSTYENYKQWLQSSVQKAGCVTDKPAANRRARKIIGDD